MFVHLNGRLVEEERALVPIFDRGFLFGDAVFESMRAYGGTVFRLSRHFDRLERSAALVGMDAFPARAEFATAITELLRANHLLDARLRLTVTRGPGRPGDYVGADGPPTWTIIAAPFTGLDPALHERGVALAIASRRAIPAAALDPAIKSTSRIASVLARREARDAGAFEAVLLDADGHLTEGTASNVFLVREGALMTPSTPGGALPGVTRAGVLEVASQAGLAVVEGRLPASLLQDADEVFLTNTSWEVLSVVRVDGRAVGDGKPGPAARDLLRLYRGLVARECAGA